MDKKELKREIGRQAIHLLIGLLVIAGIFYIGQTETAFVLGTILILGTLVINWKMLGSQVPVADWFHERFERKAQRLPGYGSAWYIIGLLFIVLFAKDPNSAAGITFILASGDAFSTVCEIIGKRTLPYNKKKHLEGSIAFVIFSLPAYFIMGPSAIILAFVGAIVEGLPFAYDDNISIPIACMFVYYLL